MKEILALCPFGVDKGLLSRPLNFPAVHCGC